MATSVKTTSIVKEDDYHVTIKNLRNLLDNITFAVGYFKAAEAIPPNINPKYGTISLYEIGADMFGLITNNHLIPRIEPQFICGSDITFEGFGSLTLRPEDINCVTTNEELDATVIELHKQCVDVFKKRKAQFLKITNAQLHNQVAMVQYPNGEFSFDKGVIIDIQGNTLYNNMSSDLGSSGSPILLWDLRAIGLHFGRSQIGNKLRHATHIPAIVDFHKASRKTAIKYMYVFSINSRGILVNCTLYIFDASSSQMLV